jgi:hypothetical protein
MLNRPTTRRAAPRVLAALAALSAAAVLGACGGSDDDADDSQALPSDQRGILSTFDQLQTASRRGDAKRICTDIFTESLATSIRRAAKRSCTAEVRATLVSPDARLAVRRDIRIRGSRAIAIVMEQTGKMSRVVLVKQGPTWRIQRITPAKAS